MRSNPAHLLRLTGAAALALALPGGALAGSSSAGEEYLSTTESVEPNIIFVVDMDQSMLDPCPDPGRSGAYTDACIDDVVDAIDLVTQHFDWARFGVVGTSPDSSYTYDCPDGSGSTVSSVYSDDFFPIAPLGSSHAEISDRLSDVHGYVTDFAIDTSNLAEAIEDVVVSYLGETTAQDLNDGDCDGIDYDFAETGIEYYCQNTHVIVLTNQRPEADDDITSTYSGTGSMSTDVTCDLAGRTTATSSTNEECYYDNVVHNLYNSDVRGDLSGTQNVTVHTIGLGIDSSSVAEELYGNASDSIGGAGIYSSASEPDGILTGILLAMQDIRSGTFSRSTPVVSAEGDYLIYTYYSLNGDDIVRSSSGMALGQGHVRAYEIDDDPTSSTYGQVLYNGPSDYGGAIWDGGDLLVSRIVTSTEFNPEDRDGFGRRDIYTFFEPAYDLSSTTLSSEGDGDLRMGFDATFVSEVAADSTVLDHILDTSTDASGCAADTTYDLSKDGCNVDSDDLQALVDFVRGWENAEFRYMAEERGRWRLGDSPHSIPVVVEGRNNNYAIDRTYRKFLEEIEDNADTFASPDIVLLAANDGMLHAFQLEDDPATADSEEGEELWAWIPGYLLERDHEAEWAGRLVDMMLYGRTFLFDGSPVVEDVWIDFDNDGVKDCNSVPSDCEWRRVVVVQQGKGGPVTLALDITDTDDPEFLWEQTDETDASAMGYTVGRPVVGNIYDGTGSTTTSGDPSDRWVAMWGSGRGVPYSSSTTYYESTEANIYMWHMGDDYFGTTAAGIQDSGGTARGENFHPESAVYGATLDTDSDAAGHYEYAYISAALAAVDVDSDGDVDTMYFPVTTSYAPTSEGGTGPGDTADPGATWMYKACLDTDNPGELEFIEFFDPVDDGSLSSRPEVYYAATTSWMKDGSLGVYWGTGTPYSRLGSDDGHFFAVKDTAPMSCASDAMEPITDCGTDGVVTLDSGEGLTADPTVYAGVVYFSTWVPDTDRCDGGAGRLYGLRYDDCTPGLDTDGDGAASTTDDDYVEEEDSYISGVTVTDKGTLFYGTSDVTTDGSGDAVGTITAATDPFLGTDTLAWMEVF